MRAYLDNGATTQTASEVIESMKPYWQEKFGNPQSMHGYGREAQEAIEKARETIAKKLGFKTEELIFTGSGTESNNTAIFGIVKALKHKGKHIITTQIEHVSVLEACKQLEGYKITYLPVDKEGIVKLEALQKALTKETILVSIMHANNEIGTIQPIEEIHKICQENNVIFHTDAMQSFCKTKTLKADLVSINAHKIHGPKGIGALAIKEGTPLTPLLVGGPHEFSKRAGTQNVPGITGFAKATEIITEKDIMRMTTLRDKLIDGLKDVAILNGSRKQRLCNNANLAFRKEAESLMLLLDEKGIACSMGSACQAQQLTPSHVLKALNLPLQALKGSLRFVLSKYTTEEEINYAIKTIRELA